MEVYQGLPIYDDWLVVFLEHDWIIFLEILVIIIPTDELKIFRGVGIPPTSYNVGLD